MPIAVHVEDRSRRRRTFIIFGLIVLAVLVLAYFRWRSNGFDWAAFAATFTGVNWLWLSGSVPAILAAYFGRVLRWHVMIRPARPDASRWNIFIATAIGFTAIVFFGRAGELVRPYLIASKEKVSFSSQMAAWLLERMLDLMMVLLLFGFALAQVSNSGISPGPRLKVLLEAGGLIVGLTGALCLAMFLLFRYFTDNMQQRLLGAITFLPERYRRKIEEFLAAFISGMQSTRSNSHVVLLIVYSIVEWILIIGCYVCILKAFPVTASFSLTDVIIFMGFVSFGAAVQIPGVGGGVQVAAVLVFTEFFSIPFEAATGMALVLWGATFVVIVPFGVVLAFREGLEWRSLGHIAQEAQK